MFPILKQCVYFIFEMQVYKIATRRTISVGANIPIKNSTFSEEISKQTNII